MTAQALETPRFLRKTTLRPNEYNTNFRMVDADVLEAVSSEEADGVTPLMSKVYLRLLQAPEELREGDRVLRFTGEEAGEGKWSTAWEQLCRHLRVSGETASKALRWMHERGVIGYYAGKNGVGIRIFLNRAASSIGVRRAGAVEKNLSGVRASDGRSRTSAGAVAFKDNLTVVKEASETVNPRAPGGADDGEVSGVSSGPGAVVDPDVLVCRIVAEVEPRLRQAAREEAAREHSRTREWLDRHGIPKATRVAQREAYDVLRRQGLVVGGRDAARGSEVGRNQYHAEQARELSGDEIIEMAQACVAVLETHGRAVDVTLSEMSSEAGGFLLSTDAPRVREAALRIIGEGGAKG